MSTETQGKEKDPNILNYFYRPGEQVALDGSFLTDAIIKLRKMLTSEVVEQVEYRYTYVNAETGETVKKAKQEDINSGKVVKIADIEKMFDAEPTRALTQKGVEILFMLRYLESKHNENIENGLATHATELNND